MRSWGETIAIAGTLAAIFALLRRRPANSGNSITQDMPSHKPSQPKADDNGSNPGGRQHSGAVYRMIPWSLLVISVGLIALTFILFVNQHLIAAIALSLAPLALTSFLARGPRPHRIKVVKQSALFIFGYELLWVLTITIFLTAQGLDPAELLQIAPVAMGALGIALFVAATWIPKWRFTEPLALGLFAICLGAICLPPVLQLIGNGPPRPINLNDNGILFSSGPANQALSLDVQVDPLSGPPNREAFQISNLGKTRIRWALLLTGSAQLRAISHGSSRLDQQSFVMGNSMSFVSPQTQAQILTGSINGNASINFTGIPYGNFMKSVGSAGDRSLVELPIYGRWIYPLDYRGPFNITLDGKVSKLIIAALGSDPPVMKNFTVVVSGGHLPPFDSLAQVGPPMAPNPKDPTELRWRSSAEIAPYYVTIAQGVVDVNDILFVFAILLGVAGAALIGSLQATIHIISSRKSD